MSDNTKPAANTMRAEEFNRRWEAVWERIEAVLANGGAGSNKDNPEEAIVTELYILQQELPPSSRRYHLAEDIIETWGRDLIKLVPATDKKAREASWKEPKLRPEQKATRGKTVKATPADRAMGALQAANASYKAHLQALQAAKRQLAQAEKDFQTSYERLIAAGQVALFWSAGSASGKPQRGGTQKPASAPTARKPAATPKGALSDAMKDTLSFIATGKGLARTGLSLQQVSAARMHLAMRKLVEKNAEGAYTLTAAGKAALKAES